jgi:hypothetical protein
MTMRRLQTGILMFAVALAIVPLPARAQSGVLIGMATHPAPDGGEREKAPAFRTVWIAHDAARARRLTTIPALVVPRRDGFWRLGLTNVCEGSEDAKNQSDRDIVWVVPIGATPVLTQRSPCGPVVKPPAPMAPWEMREKGFVTHCGYEHLAITFVSPDFVAVSRVAGQSEECEPRGYRSYASATVRRLDSLDTPIEYASVAGAWARPSVRRQAEPDPGCRDLDFSDLPGELSDWLIERRAGRWRALTFFQPGLADCMYTNEIQQPLPLAATGHDTLVMPWTSIVAAVPQATDAFSSPAADMLVVVAQGELQVFEVRRRSLGRKLVTVPSGQVVMIQWALGRNVARWTTALSQIAANPLREPVTQSGSAFR